MNALRFQWQIIILFFFIVGASACDCNNVDCEPSNPELYFHYVSSDTIDLLDGPAKKYDPEDLRLATVDTETGDSIFSTFRVEPLEDSLSLAVTPIETFNARWFLQVNKKVTDTVDLVYRTVNTHCCGKYTNITTVTLNGDVIGFDDKPILIERD